jgi:hypothetical protein
LRMSNMTNSAPFRLRVRGSSQWKTLGF